MTMADEVEELTRVWNQAWLAGDAARVEELMSDDYVYVAPGGQTLDRAGILAIIRSPSYRLDEWTRTEAVVQRLGEDAALVRHRGRGKGAFEGRPFTEDHRCVSVFVRVAGRWRIAFEQCTVNSSDPSAT